MPTRPARNQTSKKPAPSSASHARGALVSPRRCPNCYANLRGLPPVPAGAVTVATLVARHTLAGEEVAARAITEEVSERGRRTISHSQVADQLRRAARDGLLRRTRHTQAEGGFHYRYEPTPALVAYLEEDGLALQVADLLGLVPQATRLLGRTMFSPVSTVGSAARAIRQMGDALSPRSPAVPQ